MTQPEPKRPRTRFPLPPMPEEARRHAEAARDEFEKALDALIPPSLAAQRRAARRQMLLVMRGLLTSALERVDAEVKDKKGGS